jgi:hypothetical protein
MVNKLHKRVRQCQAQIKAKVRAFAQAANKKAPHSGAIFSWFLFLAYLP